MIIHADIKLIKRCLYCGLMMKENESQYKHKCLTSEGWKK